MDVVRWKFLLRPSWLALVAGVLAFAFACFWLLSPWQFSRNSEREAQNSAVERSMTATAQPLNSALAPGVAPNAQNEWARVSITGSYVPQDEVVARLRTVQGEPAYEVLTPFHTTDGQYLLIDRGYLSVAEHDSVPSYAAPPTGIVEVTARVRQDETDGKHRDAFSDASTGGKLQSYVVDSRVIARSSGLPIRPGYFQLDQNQPGVLNALPLPQLDSGPFFSYALQWIAFGVMALAGLAYFTIRELKPGGVLAEMGDRAKEKRARKRKSVAQILAEDEAEEASSGGGADRSEQPARQN